MKPRSIKNSQHLEPKTKIPEDFHFLSKTTEVAGKIVQGIDVETHCKITGFVAQELLKVLPQKIRNFLFEHSDILLAAIHDVGKMNLDFQKMIYKNLSDYKNDDEKLNSEIPIFKDGNSERAKRDNCSFHAKVTKDTICEKDKQIQLIEEMHHGKRAASTYVCPDGEEWKQKRIELLSKLEKLFLENEEKYSDLKNLDFARIIGGFITVCDWIASGGEFAKLTFEQKFSDSELIEMSRKSVSNAGFSKINVKKNLSFSDIFGFEPREIQKTLYESVKTSGVCILEAPMGMGKTEAALYIAYKMLEEGKANGIYFALPTQLTSNKIYSRVLKFLDKILDSDSEPLKLLHSSANLEITSILGEDGEIGKSWFDFSKRGILAPFAVGTVDQALMSVMNVKHSFVRAFGLAGKVVILDEIHSYDSYTGSILNTLIQFLKNVGCTVILLSATLTESQKNKILQNTTSLNQDYPLITKIDSEISGLRQIDFGKIEQIGNFKSENKNVSISVEELIDENYENAIEKVLDKAFNGEQILWIENTVADAQEIYKLFKAKVQNQIECGLIHSRFIKKERSKNEEKWVSLYGSDGTEKRKTGGRILVGTQVLEQSIDIDADFLVTKICPTDMLLQRIGRLWRHKKNDSIRPKNAKCECLIIVPKKENKKLDFEKIPVYDKYIINRSFEVWNDKKTISIPCDIRNLLEETYSERDETEALQRLKNEMLKKKSELESAAIHSEFKMESFLNVQNDDNAKTRYSDEETVSVLILKSKKKAENGILLTFIDDETLFIPSKIEKQSEKTLISSVLMKNTVTVYEKDAPKYEASIVSDFERFVFIGKDETFKPFRVAILGDDGYLKPETKSGNKIIYNSNYGYQIRT